jgi:hypothetical protein
MYTPTEKNIKNFWKHVDKTASGCWNWTAFKDKNNYGQFCLGTKRVGAHRFSLLIAGFDLTTGPVVMHHCDNPSCVNPAHLKITTQSENIQDCINKGRFKKKQKTCQTPLGLFDSLKSASLAHNISHWSLRRLIVKYPTEYYYIE